MNYPVATQTVLFDIARLIGLDPAVNLAPDQAMEILGFMDNRLGKVGSFTISWRLPKSKSGLFALITIRRSVTTRGIIVGTLALGLITRPIRLGSVDL